MKLLVPALLLAGLVPVARAQAGAERVVTRFLVLSEAPDPGAMELLERYVGEGADVSYYSPTSTLTITDIERNVQALAELLELVATPPVTVHADVRTGGLVLIGTRPGVRRVNRLIRRLDRPAVRSSRARRGVFVLRLQNSHVQDLKPTLDAIFFHDHR